MGLGGIVAKFIDLPGLLKGLFSKLYAMLFAKEIAKRDADEKAVKAEVQTQLTLVKDDQRQVDALEAQKAPIQAQIAREQAQQAQDVAAIQKVNTDEKAQEDAIDRQSDLDAFDSLQSGRRQS